jgi:hypothetical protein
MSTSLRCRIGPFVDHGAFVGGTRTLRIVFVGNDDVWSCSNARCIGETNPFGEQSSGRSKTSVAWKIGLAAMSCKL